MAPIDKMNSDYLDWLDVIQPKIERSSSNDFAKYTHSPEAEPRKSCNDLENNYIHDRPLLCHRPDTPSVEKIHVTPVNSIEKRITYTRTWNDRWANAWQQAKTLFATSHSRYNIPKTDGSKPVINPRFLWWSGREDAIIGEIAEDDDRPLPIKARDSVDEEAFSNIALHDTVLETTNLTQPLKPFNTTDKGPISRANFSGFHFREAQQINGRIPVGIPNHEFLFENTGVDKFLGGIVVGIFVFFGIKWVWESLREPRNRP